MLVLNEISMIKITIVNNNFSNSVYQWKKSVKNFLEDFLFSIFLNELHSCYFGRYSKYFILHHSDQS